jgi:hypothetical protein
MEFSLPQAKRLIRGFDHESIEVKSNSKSHIIKVKVSGNRKEFLEQIKDKLQKSDFIAELIAKSSFSKSNGHVKIGNIYIVAKPVTGATENLGIYTAHLTKFGEQIDVDIFGSRAPCSVFNNHKQIVESIMRSFEGNKRVSPWIIKSFGDYFKNIKKIPHEFQWNSKIKQSEKNELGKYLGEVILGVIVAADGIVSVCNDESFIRDVDDPKRLIYPTAANFRNIDSLIDTGNLVPISNKLGLGASASFFSNILPFLGKTNIPILKQIQACYSRASHLTPGEQQFSIIYDYGIKHCLKENFKYKQDYEPIQLYRDLKNHDITKLVRATVVGIKGFAKNASCKTHDKMLEYLREDKNYSSVTGFFSREIAKDLNNSPKAISHMESILAGKDFYQATLNYSKWLKGEIAYTVKKPGELKLVIIGDKAGYNDLQAHSGKLTYVLKQK